ncbi:MAG: hypothetical protein P8Y12_11155 [Gammaproteobacteria bacterium]
MTGSSGSHRFTIEECSRNSLASGDNRDGVSGNKQWLISRITMTGIYTENKYGKTRFQLTEAPDQRELTELVHMIRQQFEPGNHLITDYFKTLFEPVTDPDQNLPQTLTTK